MVVVAIENEATPDLAQFASSLHWINIGQLGKLIDIFKREAISEAMMAGQVKHVSIFSSIKPDWRLFKMLASLKEKNTAALIGGVQKVLREEGIELVDSTRLLKPLLAPEGVLTKRQPTKDEEADIHYGRRIASNSRQRPISARASRSARKPASRRKRWKAPMPCCAALLHS